MHRLDNNASILGSDIDVLVDAHMNSVQDCGRYPNRCAITPFFHVALHQKSLRLYIVDTLRCRLDLGKTDGRPMSSIPEMSSCDRMIGCILAINA
jgi:hypothetical protein